MITILSFLGIYVGALGSPYARKAVRFRSFIKVLMAAAAVLPAVAAWITFRYYYWPSCLIDMRWARVGLIICPSFLIGRAGQERLL